MSGLANAMDPGHARQLWALLAEEGKAPTEIGFAGVVLPSYSVGIDPWLDRLSRTYLQDLSRRFAHFKIVMAPYGGGKTHFLMSLGARALAEGCAVSYVACAKGVSLASPMDVYRAFAKALQLPGADRPGIRALLERVVHHKLHQIAEAGAPNPEVAFARWLEQLSSDEYPDNGFGRVMAEALREAHDPMSAGAGDGARRWLLGDVDTLTREELIALRLARVPARAQADLGRNLLLSLVLFAKDHGGVESVVILFDEVETLFNATGKALDRVLAAMRIMVDLPGGVPKGVPLLGVFSAVPDVLEQMGRYPALQQRMGVLGAGFDEGNDFAVQIPLDRLGDQQHFLRELGARLIDLGEAASGHPFDRALQTANVTVLARIAARRNLQVDARRLFVKTCIGLLTAQSAGGERRFEEDELAQRYAGSLDSLRSREEAEAEP